MANFREISDKTRMGGWYFEADGTQAGLDDGMPDVLIVGHKLPSGIAPAGEIVRVASVEDAIKKAGAGSMLAQMVKEYREGDSVFNVHILPYADNPIGVQATGSIKVSDVPPKSSVIALYIADRLVSIGVSVGMTASALAAAISSSINSAGDDIPVTATSAEDTVTLTARHKGTCGNNIDIRLSIEDEEIPDGLTLEITAMADGAGDPAPGDVSAILGRRRWFRYIVLGMNDNATLTAWHEESQFRFTAQPIQKGFRIFTAFRGDLLTAAEYGEKKNYEHIGNLALGINPTPTWEAAAQLAAAAAPSFYNNPVTSTEDIKLVGMRGLEYFKWEDANSLLYSGMSVMSVNDDGSCSIKRLISMYQKRPDGAPDDAWLDLNTAETMERVRLETNTEGKKRFTGKAASRTDEGYEPGLPIISEDSFKAFLLSNYKNNLMRKKGWVQEYEHYKATLAVKMASNSPSRFNYWQQTIVNSPFYIAAGRDTFLRMLPWDSPV